jgi:nucleotidyltransferase/DNA polymerase involved in DNA repair
MQIALVDCNNFYASCEAEFQPKLSGLALVGVWQRFVSEKDTSPKSLV